MVDVFDLSEISNKELLDALEETVNLAIQEALRRSLYSAGIRLKIDVHLRQENDCLVPEYSYKTGYSIGGNVEGNKGKMKSTVGVKRTSSGLWDPVLMPEQISMVK